MDYDVLDNSSSSPVSSVGLSRPAGQPASPHSRHSLGCCCCSLFLLLSLSVHVGLDENGNIGPKGAQGLPVAKRVWAPGAEKEIPIC